MWNNFYLDSFVSFHELITKAGISIAIKQLATLFSKVSRVLGRPSRFVRRLFAYASFLMRS